MFRYFKQLLGAKKGIRRPTIQARPWLVSLESRDLPSAGPSLFAAHAGHFGSSGHVGAAASTLAVSDGVLQAASGTGHTHALTATLSGITGAAGQVTFTPTSTAGQNTFTLSVSGLTASQTYSVQVDGTEVGQVTTGTAGSGSATLSNLSAAIAVGSVVTVVDTSTTPSTTVLTGTLATEVGCHDHAALTANLTGTTGSGHAAVFSDLTSLKVSVSGLTPAATYTVQIVNGTSTTTAGTITTDANGHGKLSASLAAAISAGATINVVDSTGAIVLTGTFAIGSGH